MLSERHIPLIPRTHFVIHKSRGFHSGYIEVVQHISVKMPVKNEKKIILVIEFKIHVFISLRDIVLIDKMGVVSILDIHYTFIWPPDLSLSLCCYFPSVS